MRNALLLALLVPALALAVSNLSPVTAVAPENGVPTVAPVERVDGNREPATSVVLVGTVDTIGGTTYDWQSNGPAYRMLVNSYEYGLHAAWMFSASDQPEFPDRNLRYNFYDYAASAWNWVDPDFMQSGVNVFTERCGYGNLDADPVTGVAEVSCHIGLPIHPDVGRDMAPGAGIFEYCTGSPVMEGYLWPYISTGQNQTIHCHCIDDASRGGVFYSQVNPWCTWADPVGMASPQPNPDFPNQNIGASDAGDNLCVTWEFSMGAPDPGFYRISTDGGTSWENPMDLPWPPAYGGDTATSYHITSLFPFYDANDKLHIAAGVMPYVGGSGYIIPAQLWHWSPDHTPNWTHIYTATCAPENLLAAVGYNAIYACRMSLGEDNSGNLYVAWEQFDSSNVEPGPPEVLRADIFVAGSGSGGDTWGEPVKITGGGTGSHRFPGIVDKAYAGTDEEMIAVTYIIDQVAGFFVQGEGPCTNNPVICHWVPKSAIPCPGGAIGEERGSSIPRRFELTATPNPFGRRTVISYTLPRASEVSLVISDAAGRPVRTLEHGVRQAGRYTVAWDGRTANGEETAAGIYFYTLNTDDTSLTEKLIVVH